MVRHHVWKALLDVNEHIDTWPIEEVEKRILGDGIGILAEILHPDCFAGEAPAGSFAGLA